MNISCWRQGRLFFRGEILMNWRICDCVTYKNISCSLSVFLFNRDCRQIKGAGDISILFPRRHSYPRIFSLSNLLFYYPQIFPRIHFNILATNKENGRFASSEAFLEITPVSFSLIRATGCVNNCLRSTLNLTMIHGILSITRLNKTRFFI